MFRLRHSLLDERVERWALSRHGGQLGLHGIDALSPGFSLPELLADVDHPGEAHYGRATRELFRFVYWLFVGGMGPAEHLGPMPGKPVLLADTYVIPPNGLGRAFLAVHADGGAILVPCPRVPDELLAGAPYRTVREARQALHETAQAFVERANLVWPAALALANDRH